jgi:hypothetical protein
MSLVELMIVVGVLGVIFAAVFFFFTKGMQQFHFSRRQNELSTAGRLALEQITDEIIWAGYLPYGGIDGDLWHPVHETDPGSFTFYADYHEPWGQLDDDEYRRIFLAVDNTVLITDKAVMQRRAGYNISSVQFVYMDEDGDELAQPLSLQDRDAVRHIRVTLVLQDTYMGDIYHTTMRTTISPRNLGLNRDIDPMFIPVPPLSGIAVVNVDGDSTAFAPTAHQYRMIHKMAYWGLTVISLTDDMLETYDYVGNEIDMVILRDIAGGSYHSWMNVVLNSLPCAVICLDPDDAAYVYGMANLTGNTNLYYDNLKVVSAHHIHDGIPSASPSDLVFTMYDSTLVPPVTPVMNYIDDITLITETITTINAFGSTPGLVSVRDEELPTRRVFYGLPAVTGYSADGYSFLYNVLHWTLGGAGSGDPGDPITASEGFEGAGSAVSPVVLWEDDLNAPQVVSDSIPLFADDFSAKGGKDLTWNTYSLGPDGMVGVVDESLRMQRRVAGAQTRNLAGVLLDLSPYSILTDNLYLKVSTLRGINEIIEATDGVFFLDFTGIPQTILTQNFNNVGMASGDITFWGSLYGRSRVHAPSGWPGNGGFATLDSRREGFDGQVRMMIEVPTTGLASNTQFTVNFRFHDHNDQNHPYNAGDGTGDFLGWNSHGVIEGAVNHVADFVPQNYDNAEWTERSAVFTIPGVPPDPLYLVFAQYDNGMASGFSASRGISIDDVEVIAGSADTTYTRIGIPSSGADWSTIKINLNSAAMPPSGPGFVSNFGVILSQAGTGPWDAHGMCWDDFEVGMAVDRLTMPGWAHSPILTGIDDWSVHQSTSDPSDYMWGLHANDPDFYSNYSHCFLETPSFMVPLEAIDPELSFRSDFEFETGYDYGYVQVSVNSGAWVDLGLSSGLLYNAVIGGRNVFSGSRSWTTEVIDLAPYKGNSVRFRFVFYSDLSVIREGWYLDDFYAHCLIEGHEISAIDFQTSAVANMTFDHVEVYMGSTAQTTLSPGRWETTELFLAYSGPLTFNSTQQWQTITLDNSYFLPVDANLRVKIVSDNQTMGFGSFRHEGIDNVCRAAWGGTPPTFLPVQPTRPITRVTVGGSPIVVGEGGTQYSSNMPVSFDNRFTDFEAIYTAPELGLFNPVTWTSGGTTQGTAGNEWEIGAPAFWPVPDPALTAENGTSIAGTDLTIDGFYEDEAWWWLASSGYDMADAAAYDTVNVRFYRCLKLASNDYAFVQIAFDDDPDRNPEELTWENVRTYNGVFDNSWQYEVINLTPSFNAHSSFDYYFVRFVLSSGLWLKKGGWNLDNIQFFGRTEAK